MGKSATILFASSVLLAGSAFAQNPERITLQIGSGDILTSTGGEFASASNGQALVIGEQLQVNPGSSARVVFNRGTDDTADDCVVVFDKPGVYGVPAECKRGAGWTATSGGLSTGALIVGGAALAALLVNSNGGDAPTPPPPPVSLGNN